MEITVKNSTERRLWKGSFNVIFKVSEGGFYELSWPLRVNTRLLWHHSSMIFTALILFHLSFSYILLLT